MKQNPFNHSHFIGYINQVSPQFVKIHFPSSILMKSFSFYGEDLKVKSIDVEAWSPRQKKYFEVGSCSNLGDAQARRLKIRVNGEENKYFAHTLNNTVAAPPRMLIAFLENNLREDGSVKIPEALRPYMGGKTEIR